MRHDAVARGRTAVRPAPARHRGRADWPRLPSPAGRRRESRPCPPPRPSTTPRSASAARWAAGGCTLYTIIFEADTRAGRLFDLALIWFILASVGVVVLDSFEALHARWGPLLKALEWFFTLSFTLEYIARLACVRRPSRYARSVFGIIDLIAVLPTWLSLFVPGLHALIDVRLLRLLRLFRILRLAQYVDEYRALAHALLASRRKIFVFLSFVLIVTVVMGTVMYVVEGPANGFANIPVSVYWAISTLTTVGFGDITPKTGLGRTIASLMMLIGWGTLAVPTGIVRPSSRRCAWRARACRRRAAARPASPKATSPRRGTARIAAPSCRPTPEAEPDRMESRMRPHQNLRFCTSADGTRIAIASIGSGPPLVRAAHWLSHVEHDLESPVWGPWLAELSKHHTYLRYDQRGCGLSDADIADFSLDAWVADLEAVVAASGLRRFPLIGMSQGGAVAIAYAVRHPEQVSHLVLVGAYARGALRRAVTADAAPRGRDAGAPDPPRLGARQRRLPPCLHQPVHPRGHAGAARLVERARAADARRRRTRPARSRPSTRSTSPRWRASCRCRRWCCMRAATPACRSTKAASSPP